MNLLSCNKLVGNMLSYVVIRIEDQVKFIFRKVINLILDNNFFFKVLVMILFLFK